uniref:Arcelin-5B n=1 Tax=Phaseolus vulgaris TaxID=3885 RepID=AR5B_PHAVU|nr:RecName: Full=Arcelin-5B; Flags: Precursor [Phaseolus vulgaris]CAA85418.1 Arcelin 5 [Phaseolus vulgaris]
MASSKLLSLALFLVLLTHANSATETSFNFPNFHTDDKLILQGDATISSKGQLRLTGVTPNGDPRVDSMGRAFYSDPIQIKDSNNVASFNTNFTFIIRTKNQSISAYGLAFALVRVNSPPQKKQEFLGIFNTNNPEPNARTVAVVFNTFKNRIDFDKNFIKPYVNENCDFHKYNGEKTDVQITYDSSNNDLRVFLHFTVSQVKCSVSATVHLEKEVDEWVSVGFSPTSGLTEDTTETHDVLSWSFSSKFRNKLSNILLNNIL